MENFGTWDIRITPLQRVGNMVCQHPNNTKSLNVFISTLRDIKNKDMM